MSLYSSLIVADDIRQEVSGKLIVIGMYTNDITIPLESFIVPQLSVLFTVEGPHTKHPAELTFEVTLPGEKPQDWKIPLHWDRPHPPTFESKDRKRWKFRIPFALGFVTLRKGPITSKISFDDQEIFPVRHWIQYLPPEPIP